MLPILLKKIRQTRMRRSYSLKAKLSENEGIFSRRSVFSLCSHASETLQKAKTMKVKRKEKQKIAIPVKV